MPHTALEPQESDLVALLTSRFETWLDELPHPPRSETRRALVDRCIHAPAREFLTRTGKGFRGRLVETAWALAGGSPGALPVELPLVLEILHAGSLIVDDVQDQSERRRGRPALHHLVGEPLAINTGNLLYCWALDLLADLGLPAERELAMHRSMSRSMVRCHQGQAVDLTTRMDALPQTDVAWVVETSTTLKAGELMELAATLGAVGAGANRRVALRLASFGRSLGTALQMLDDLSGLLRPERREKAREDLRHARPTWPWAWLSVDLDPREFRSLQHQARDLITDADVDALADHMAALVAPVGRTRVRSHLQSSLRTLQDDHGRSPTFDRLAEELRRLERSYVGP